jgi:hypothetical protein
MRKRGLVVLLLFAASVVLGQEGISPVERCFETDEEHTKWIDSVMGSILTIKPGMTRKDLFKVFKEEGGVFSRTRRKYVYKECPYIKVDVEFTPVGNEDNPLTEEMPEDKITSISRPYLEYGITD